MMKCFHDLKGFVHLRVMVATGGTEMLKSHCFLLVPLMPHWFASPKLAGALGLQTPQSISDAKPSNTAKKIPFSYLILVYYYFSNYSK